MSPSDNEVKEDSMRVLVKAWFDHRSWEGKVIGESIGDFGNRMLLVAPDVGSAKWRDEDDCMPMLPIG